MTKQFILLIFLAFTLVLGGCMMSGATTDKKGAKDSNKGKLAFPEPPEDPRFYYERTIKNSANVLPDSDTEKLKRALTGESLKGEGFAKPYGVAVHHGRIFVSDTVRRSVLVFDVPEEKFFIVGKDEAEGQGKLVKPIGIEVDGNGNLYVLDANLRMIVSYDRDGNFLQNIGDPRDLTRPAGIGIGLGVDGNATRIYAVDIGGSSTDNHRILVYDVASGKRLDDIGKRGTAPGEFNLPRDVAVAPDGSLYVVDGGNFRVQQLSADGKTVINTFGSIGRQMGQFSRPKEVAIDSEGNVYVIDAAFGNFQIFNSKGQLLLHIGSRSNFDAPANYSLPAGIAVDEDGRVYVVDQFFRKVDVFRPASLAEDEGYAKKKAGGKTEIPSAPIK